MPNGRPGGRPLTDITVFRIPTDSRRADSLAQRLHRVVSPAILWKFRCLLQREGDVTRVAGTEKRVPIREFEDIPAGLLDSAEALAGQFPRKGGR